MSTDVDPQPYAHKVSKGSEESLRRRLHPLSTSAYLIRASIVITAYELLKADVVNHIRDFFATEWMADEAVESPMYRHEVLSQAPSRLVGSLAWLERNDVLSSGQVAAFQRLRAERNRLAHELAAVLVDPSTEVDPNVLDDAADIAASLGRFWGSIAVDTDPAFDGRSVDYDDIRSGVSLLLEHLVAAAQLAESLRQVASDDLDLHSAETASTRESGGNALPEVPDETVAAD